METVQLVGERPPLQRAAAAALTWAQRHPAAVSALFAVLFAAAVVVGRATRPGGMPLALVWPAGAVGMLWLAASWHRRKHVVVDAAVLTVLAAALNAATGAPWLLAAVYGAGSGAQAVLGCALMRRLQRRRGCTPWRLRRSADLGALLIASYSGAVAPALLGSIALSVSGGAGSVPVLFVAWVMRVGTSAFVLTALAVRLLDPDVPRIVRSWREAMEMLTSSVVTGAAYVAVFALNVHLPLAFLLVPLSLWVALRFSTTFAACYPVVVGVFVVVATLAGRGPFTMESVVVRVLLAQAFVAVIAVVSLVLALHRDERQVLVVEARHAHQRADEQATLLRTIIDTTRDGLSVFDAAGHVILRNPAALELFGPTPTGVPREEWDQHYGVCTPDGTVVDVDDLPLARALGGVAVPGVDLLVRTAHRPQGRVLHMSAHPMPPAPGAGWNGGAVMAFHDVTEARAAAAEVERAHDLLSSVLDAATDLAIIATDLSGRVTVFSAGAEQMLGYRAEEVLGRTPWFLHTAEDLEEMARASGLDVPTLLAATDADRAEGSSPAGPPLDIEGVLPGSGPLTRQSTLLARDGRAVPVITAHSAMRDGTGQLTGFMATSRDISDQLAAQADLADSETRFRLAFDTAPMGMMMLALSPGAAGNVLRVNSSLCGLLGYDELALLTMNVADLLHPDDVDDPAAGPSEHAGEDHDATRVDTRYLHADGHTVWVRVSTTTVRPHDWEPYSLALIEDITARKQAEQALTHQALHDALTGLPNRTLFSDRLQHALAAAGRTGERVGVLFLDLDGFKAVNDSAGHAAGDELLRQVSTRLHACLRPGDTLARLGGDEFAIVCPGMSSAGVGGDTDADSASDASKNLRVVAERMLSALRVPVELVSGTFVVGASIGLSVADSATTDLVTAAERVLSAADEAMYGAKRAGKNRAHTAEGEEHARGARLARLLPELTRALACDELVLHGQPVLDLVTGRPVAVETLIRWQHPTRGLLSPAEFLDVAEASPLMVGIGRRVLEESCRMAAAWSETLGPAAPDVHVNVSGRQLEAGNLYGDVISALKRHGLPGHRVVLELTETHMPQIAHSLRADLQRLRARGVRIAIDDVGTGYSSLTRLTELPVDILKIDLSFVAGLGIDASCDAVVRAILSIGQALGLSVVAEGVETPQQAELLRRYGCDTVQGYLYSPPRPEGALVQHLQAAPGPLVTGDVFRDAATPLALACHDVVAGCRRTFQGTAQEILEAVADHAHRSHDLPELSRELQQVVLLAMRPAGSSPLKSAIARPMTKSEAVT
ncbi:EAL domain-containing protein [Kineococcus sp. R8]|uniref:EAL domain-containing protein n=1 Tax=Kineococcus siccus TaxID=2696567 RepID=UPI001411F236|nr:EAL domain-containing protein [Kineococcus siccus]NAZ81027.1 EAL domain-containing protein [Kineococcus siccus]